MLQARIGLCAQSGEFAKHRMLDRPWLGACDRRRSWQCLADAWDISSYWSGQWRSCRHIPYNRFLWNNWTHKTLVGGEWDRNAPDILPEEIHDILPAPVSR